VTRLPAALGVTIALALVGAGPATAQVRCARDGDYLACEDGRSYFIYPDDDGRRRGGPGLGLGGLVREPRAAAGPDGEPGAWSTSGPWLEGPDGLVCYPHGTHVHCR
jgi:hypothetical protein